MLHGLPQGTAHGANVSSERPARRMELVDEGPCFAQGRRVAWLPVFAQSAVLSVQRREQTVDGGEQRRDESELRQGP